MAPQQSVALDKEQSTGQQRQMEGMAPVSDGSGHLY